MDFGEILSKAWKTIWKHKVLWIFGIFASLGSGGGGGGGGGGGSNYQGNGNFSQGNGDWDFNGFPPELQSFFEQFADTVTNIPWYVWVLVGLGFLLLFIALIVISTIGKIGLIQGTRLTDASDEKLSFGPLFSQSLRYFWRVFLFSLITGLAIFIVMMIIMIPMVLLGVLTLGIGMLCIVPLICLLIPAMWIVGIILEQGTIAIVVEDIGVFDGLKRGWQVLKGNFWNLLLMGVILGIGSGIVGLIIALPFLLVFLPPLIAVISSGGLENWSAISSSLLVSLGLCCLIYPVVLLLGGILTAYVQSAWTLTYLRISKRSDISNLPEPQPVLETL